MRLVKYERFGFDPARHSSPIIRPGNGSDRLDSCLSFETLHYCTASAGFCLGPHISHIQVLCYTVHSLKLDLYSIRYHTSSFRLIHHHPTPRLCTQYLYPAFSESTRYCCTPPLPPLTTPPLLASLTYFRCLKARYRTKKLNTLSVQYDPTTRRNTDKVTATRAIKI